MNFQEPLPESWRTLLGKASACSGLIIVEDDNTDDGDDDDDNVDDDDI